MKLKILIASLVLATVLLNGCINLSGTSFEKGIQKIESIESKYGVTKETIVPVKETMYENYVKELKKYREQLKTENQTSDVKALNLVIEAKLVLVEMQKELNKGMNLLKTPVKNCLEAEKHFNEAKKKAIIAEQTIKLLESSYSIQAKKITEFIESVKAVTEAVEESVKTIKSICV